MVELNPDRSPAPPLARRLVNDVETLKALADPLRISILRLLMRDAARQPPVLSVKEIAERLGEPPTKLYRHIKALEARDLIVVAQTRLVSGIVESRYRTGQLDLEMDGELLDSRAAGGESTAVLLAGFTEFTNDLAAGVADGSVRFDSTPPPAESYRRPIITMADRRIPAAKAAELRDRLVAVVDEFVAAPDDLDGVPVRLMIGFYSRENAK